VAGDSGIVGEDWVEGESSPFCFEVRFLTPGLALGSSVMARPPQAAADFFFDHAAAKAMRTGEVIEGRLPGNTARLVKQWALAHRGELDDNWRRRGLARRSSRSRASAMIKVTKIKCLGGHRLRATFSDGMAGDYDFSAIVGGYGEATGALARDAAA
jgi:hypothetical protein